MAPELRPDCLPHSGLRDARCEDCTSHGSLVDIQLHEEIGGLSDVIRVLERRTLSGWSLKDGLQQ